MESSNGRWRLSCAGCGAGGAIGPRDRDTRDGWCEACQRGATVAAGAAAAACERCGGPLSLDAPRFLEAWGEIQNLVAVLAAWRGDPAPLRALLPDRPRFLSDLDPPVPGAGDAPEAAEALERLRSGEFARAQPGLVAWTASRPGEPRAWAARAIAEERRGDPAAAEESWSRAIAAGDSERARLARGALRARRGEWAGAAEDLARAGGGREARWNRAAAAIARAVEITPGLPDPRVLESARAEAGAPSEYWSDFTVGRLLWTLLVERSRARQGAGSPNCPDERVMRAAALEFEHATFWDLAMQLAGFADLGMGRDAAEVAAPLANRLARELAAAPWLRAPGAAPMRDTVETARAEIARGDAPAAEAPLVALLERADLRRFGVPCERCGGLLGAEAVEEPGSEAGGDA